VKSAVDRSGNRKFLGFTVGRNGGRLKVAEQTIDKLKDRVRELTRRIRGTTISVIVAELKDTLLGWKAYFGLSELLSSRRAINKWVRRRLRCYLWKPWGVGASGSFAKAG
jgi:RNA-directed DNA polymerase